MVKNLLANAGDVRDTGSISGLGRSPGGGHSNPFQYSFLENTHGQCLPVSLSTGLSRHEYWNGLLCPPPGELPDLGIKPMSLMSPGLAGGFFTKHLVQYNKIKFAD